MKTFAVDVLDVRALRACDRDRQAPRIRPRVRLPLRLAVEQDARARPGDRSRDARVGAARRHAALSVLELVQARHLRHRHEELPLAGERPARVLDEHVVDRDQVAGLPREVDAELLVEVPDVLHRLVRDRRAVAEVDVARHVLLGEQLPQRVARLGIEAVDVVELHLVEEQLLARARVHRRPPARSG